MKATRAGTKWAHVSCALWIPEVSIACPERMEPITKLSHIPPSRWSLICSLCKLKTGACIQCSVKNCTVPFHVTCAFEHSLEMKTILDEGDEVKFKSYCLKHSKPKSGESGLSPARHKTPTETEKVGLRAQKLQELEEEFHKLVQPEDIAQELGLPQNLLDFIYQYWKLKRKCSFNKALVPPKEEEENLLLQPQEDSIHTRMRMFMHLRQDLERVRNLCYMVSRREKLKLSQSKAQEQIFNLHVKLLNQDAAADVPVSSNFENLLFRPPPRITLKLKMPKTSLGSSKTSCKTGNGPLCPDNSSNLYDLSRSGIGQGKPQLQHARPQAEERTNGFVPVTKSTGKPLALQAALHGHSSNGKPRPEQDRFHRLKSTKLEQDRSKLLKSPRVEQDRSQIVKSPRVEQDRSYPFKSTKQEQDRSSLLKSTKLEQDRSHLQKSSKIEQDTLCLLKSSRIEQPQPHLLKSSKLEQDKLHLLMSNGIAEKPVFQRNPPRQSPTTQAKCVENCRKAQPGTFHKSTIEHLGRTFKEATVSLVRTNADLWNEKNARAAMAKDRTNCTKAAAAEWTPKDSRRYQESDGYCPDLELSDSEPEARGKRQRGGRGTKERSSAGSLGRDGVSLCSRTAVQR